eukprot:jgi/Bigna1/81668/fgenesh1_pg.82_\
MMRWPPLHITLLLHCLLLQGKLRRQRLGDVPPMRTGLGWGPAAAGSCCCCPGSRRRDTRGRICSSDKGNNTAGVGVERHYHELLRRIRGGSRPRNRRATRNKRSERRSKGNGEDDLVEVQEVSRSLLSSTPFSAAWHPREPALAVGLLKGGVVVLRSDGLPLFSLSHHTAAAPPPPTSSSCRCLGLFFRWKRSFSAAPQRARLWCGTGQGGGGYTCQNKTKKSLKEGEVKVWRISGGPRGRPKVILKKRFWSDGIDRDLDGDEDDGHDGKMASRGGVAGMCHIPRSEEVVVASEDGCLSTINVTSNTLTSFEYNENDVYSALSLTKDGRRAVVGTPTGALIVVERTTEDHGNGFSKVVYRHTLEPMEVPIEHIVRAGVGRGGGDDFMSASAFGGAGVSRVQLDTSGRVRKRATQLVITGEGTEGGITALAHSEKDGLLASGALDNTLPAAAGWKAFDDVSSSSLLTLRFSMRFADPILA